jgi:hypothetical protein
MTRANEGPTPEAQRERYTFVLMREGQAPQSVGLNPKAGAIRLAFGTPERHAAIWKISASRSGEVYVMERTTGKFLKISLHKSGDWRFQWVVNPDTAHIVDKVIEAKGSRIIDRWPRPEARSGGLTPAFGIITTGEDLRPSDPTTAPNKDMYWLPSLEPGELGYVIIALLEAGTGEPVTLRGFVPLTGFMMETGELALVLAGKRMANEEEAQLFTQRRELMQRAREAAVEHRGAPLSDTMRAIIYDTRPDGLKYIHDIAM